MAIKSDNAKGNPYHDEETGEFTSKDSSSGKNQTFHLQLKGNIDVNKLKEHIDGVKDPLTHGFGVPNSILEAEAIGNRILGSKTNAVGYDNSTSLEVAHQFNLALKDIVSIFPRFFQNDRVIAYGTKYKGNITEQSEKLRFISILSESEYQKLAQDAGITDVERFSEILAGMSYSSLLQFNAKDLSHACGGSTLAITSSEYPNNVLGKDGFWLSSSIKLNMANSKKTKNWEDYLEEGIQEGLFFVCSKGGAYYVGVHELGHHIFSQTMLLSNDSEKQQLYNLSSNSYTSYHNKQISKYATYSRHEQVAEAFADVFGNQEQATNHNKQLVQLIKNIYDRIYPQSK